MTNDNQNESTDKMTDCPEFSQFMKYVGGNSNLIAAIRGIELQPERFAQKVESEIEKFGFSNDTAASELRSEMIGYLLSHSCDSVGFDIGKRLFDHMQNGSVEHLKEKWCYLLGLGAQRIIDNARNCSDKSTDASPHNIKCANNSTEDDAEDEEDDGNDVKKLDNKIERIAEKMDELKSIVLLCYNNLMMK